MPFRFRIHPIQISFGHMTAIFPGRNVWLDFLDPKPLRRLEAFLTKKGILEMLTSATRVLANMSLFIFSDAKHFGPKIQK